MIARMRKQLLEYVNKNGGQSRLAKQCNVTQATISRWISGKSDPRPKKGVIVSRITGIPFSELYQ